MSGNKSEILQARVELVNDKLHFEGKADENTPISIDYTPPLGDNLGYTSLELFLLSLSSCVGSAVLTLLRKMRKTITGFSIDATGFRKQEHPTGFHTVRLEIHLNSPDTSQEEVRKVLEISESTICPVWSMIQGNVKVESIITIGEPTT